MLKIEQMEARVIKATQKPGTRLSFTEIETCVFHPYLICQTHYFLAFHWTFL